MRPRRFHELFASAAMVIAFSLPQLALAQTPSAPAGVSAVWTANGVNLSWIPSAGAVSYRVYRGATSGGESGTPLETWVTTSSYLDTTSVIGQQYYYQVTEVNSSGVESARSVEALSQAALNIVSFHGSTPDSLGVNPNETVLTPGNLIASKFGMNFSTRITDTPNLDGIPSSVLNASINYTAVNGQSYCEPLVKTDVTITSGSFQGLHDVVFVATELGSLYAIDANNGTVLWKDSFIYNAAGNPNPLNPTIPNGTTAIPGGLGTEENSSDVSPWICIMGTPVIDPTNNVIYLIANTRYVANGPAGDQGNPHYIYTIHKVNLSNGQDTSSVFAETILNDAQSTFTYVSGPWVNGTGDYTSQVFFNAMRQMGRPALQLYNGQVYAAFASHGDILPFHGWVLAFDSGSLAVNGAFCTTPNGSEGGIWQGGDSVVFDSSGYFYAMTGNGTFESTLNANGFPSQSDYGDCFIKLESDPTSTEGNQGSNPNGWGIKLVDYFSPSNNATLDDNDLDLGSGGPIILPAEAGSTAYPDLMVGSGKQGTVYLVNRDNMGKFNAGTDNVVQELVSLLSGCFSTPAYFNGRLYYSPSGGGSTVSWTLASGSINTSTVQSGSDNITYPGGPPNITASGTQNGIAWIMDRSTGQLRAYNASNLATELWTSNLNPASDALPGGTMKFAVPTPVNGRVYALSTTSLCVYGAPLPVTSGPAAPTNLTATPANPFTITLNWTNNSNIGQGFAVERSGDGVNFTQIATAAVNVTTYTDSSLAPATTCYYRVRAYNSYLGLTYSAYTNTASATTPALAGSIYYWDRFSRSGELVGSAPTTDTNGNTWTVSSGIGGYSTNGSLAVIAGSINQFNVAYLPVNGASGVTLDGTKDFILSVMVLTSGTAGQTGISLSVAADPGSLYANSLAAIGTGSFLGAYIYNQGGLNYNFSAPITPATVSLAYSASAGTLTYTVGGTVLLTQTGVASSQIAALSSVAMGDQGYGGGMGAPEPTFANFLLTVGGSSAALAAPTGLVAAAGNTQVVLNWNSSAGATSYNVYQGASSGGESATPIATGLTATSYTNTGLTNGTPYYYTVKAVSASGTSGYSNETSATPTSGGSAPSAPTGLSATAGNTQISLGWTAATGATSYNIYRGASSGGENASPVATGIATASYTDSGLTNGTPYYYTVAAVNSSGTSGYSNEASATPTGGGGAPTGGIVGVQFPQYYDGPVGRLNQGGGNGYTAGVIQQQYWNMASNATGAGDGIISNPVTNAALITGTGNTPTGTLYDSTGAISSVQFSLTNVTNNSHGSASGAFPSPVWYTAGGLCDAYLASGVDFSESVSTPASLTMSGLNASGTYNLIVYVGSAWYYNSASVSVALGSTTYYLKTDGSNSLTGWTQSTATSAGSAPTANYVEFTGITGAALMSGTLTVNGAGSGLCGFQLALLEGTGGGAPATPTGLVVASGTMIGQISVNWTASTGAQIYLLQRSTSSGGAYTSIATITTPATTYTDSGPSLTAGQNYYYEIAAANTSGTSAFSTFANATPYVPATFSGWAYTYFGLNAPSSQSGDTANPAHDGLPNLLKYALGLNPLVPATFHPVVTPSGASWQFTFVRPANRADITYSVQVSPDLSTWTTNGVSLTEIGSGDPETWQATFTPAGGSKLFFRLQVSGP